MSFIDDVTSAIDDVTSDPAREVRGSRTLWLWTIRHRSGFQSRRRVSGDPDHFLQAGRAPGAVAIRKKTVSRRLAACLFSLLLLVPAAAFPETVEQPPPSADPEVADCVKCHFDILRILKKRGGKHRDKLTCIRCHEGHPPDGANVIPQCSNCHQGQEHFTLPDCLLCHNPHKPLDITLPNRLTDPCLTCHKKQQEQLVANPSVHSQLGCTACHKQHGKIPSCFRCHEPHTADQDDVEICGHCHAAHRPLAVAYSDDTPSEVCGSCHPAVLATLRASKAKHASFACVKCHPEKHKYIPQCSECHGKPHSEAILSLTRNCNDCHHTAHDLVF